MSAQDDASATIDGVGKKLEGLGGKGGGGALHQLKAAFGRGSTFKETFEVLEGGGAVLGLTLAGQALKEMTGEAVKLRDELNEGKISVGEMTEKMLAAVPIFGSIFEAGRNIRELLTGEAAAAKDTMTQAEAINAVLDARLMIIKETKKESEEFAKLAGKFNAAGYAVGLEGAPKAFEDQRQKEKDRNAQAIDLAKEQKGRLDKEIKAAEEKVKELEKKALPQQFSMDMNGQFVNNSKAYGEAVDARAAARRQLEDLKKANEGRRDKIDANLEKTLAASDKTGRKERDEIAKEFTLKLADGISKAVADNAKKQFANIEASREGQAAQDRELADYKRSSRVDELEKEAEKLRQDSQLRFSSGEFSPLLSGFAQAAREANQTDPKVQQLKSILDELRNLRRALPPFPFTGGIEAVDVPGL